MNKQIKERLLVISLFLLSVITANAADKIIKVSQNGNAASAIRAALEKAAAMKGSPVTLKLDLGVWNIPREESTVRKFYISNTTSESENPDPSKHIALLMRGLRNVTIDGSGSTLMLDGEMSAFVIDSCQNITLRNLTIDNAHPTQTEMTVEADGKDYMICRTHATSQYRIKNGKVEWYGRGWAFTNGIAQWYDPVRDVTWRDWSPTDNVVEAREMEPGKLYIKYNKKPAVPVGTVFQMRDAIRREACGLIWQSKNVRLDNVRIYYLSNFGVVGQVSENISIHRCWFAPEEGSGRTNAGFADFVQMSGCRGLIDITDTKFAGAHDDPINVHGTHLQIVRATSANTLLLRYMHHQTFGFQSFHAGDDIEIVNPENLLAEGTFKVKKARMVSPREIEITLTKPVSANLLKNGTRVVENITWTPRVHIARCHFSRIPTRGILITTRQPSVIEDNYFYGMQMSAILVADDARSWFESGPVHNLTIRNNVFNRCLGSIIWINPENRKKAGAVHRNITIENNVFTLNSKNDKPVVYHSVDNLKVNNNIVINPDGSCGVAVAEEK